MSNSTYLPVGYREFFPITVLCSSTLSGLGILLLVPWSIGYLTLAGFRGIEISRTILKGLNVNNIRQSLVKERVIFPPNKTPRCLTREQTIGIFYFHLISDCSRFNFSL